MQWEDPRFASAVDSVRAKCNVAHRDDDAMIGMLLDRYSWNEGKVVDLYNRSVARREELGCRAIRQEIMSNNLTLEQFPHHQAVGKVIPIFASTSLERPKPVAGKEQTVTIDGKQVSAGDVIGCYELRYGEGESTTQEATVTPQEFTKYMVYVTQWRWMQCEAYIHRHGRCAATQTQPLTCTQTRRICGHPPNHTILAVRVCSLTRKCAAARAHPVPAQPTRYVWHRLGFWSMIHDLSCPQGFLSLWGRARSIFGSYMTPVEEERACCHSRTHAVMIGRRVLSPALSRSPPLSPSLPLSLPPSYSLVLYLPLRPTTLPPVPFSRPCCAGLLRSFPANGAEDPDHQCATLVRPSLVSFISILYSNYYIQRATLIRPSLVDPVHRLAAVPMSLPSPPFLRLPYLAFPYLASLPSPSLPSPPFPRLPLPRLPYLAFPSLAFPCLAGRSSLHSYPSTTKIGLCC